MGPCDRSLFRPWQPAKIVRLGIGSVFAWGRAVYLVDGLAVVVAMILSIARGLWSGELAELAQRHVPPHALEAFRPCIYRPSLPSCDLVNSVNYSPRAIRLNS